MRWQLTWNVASDLTSLVCLIVEGYVFVGFCVRSG